MNLGRGSYQVGQNLYRFEWRSKYRFRKEENLCEDIFRETSREHGDADLEITRSEESEICSSDDPIPVLMSF